jgi:hypothetical protein
MGVLDDAIREHLELKRKHGAAQDEVEQQEQEALGAPRREPVEVEQAVPEPAAQAAELEAVEQAAEPEPAPEVVDTAPESVETPPEAVEPEVEDETEPEAPAAQDTPPRGFERIEEAEAPPAEGDEEDVLEETPDFLQETPEHDRLWFEQKPPRDFDFDE